MRARCGNRLFDVARIDEHCAEQHALAHGRARRIYAEKRKIIVARGKACGYYLVEQIARQKQVDIAFRIAALFDCKRNCRGKHFALGLFVGAFLIHVVLQGNICIGAYYARAFLTAADGGKGGYAGRIFKKYGISLFVHSHILKFIIKITLNQAYYGGNCFYRKKYTSPTSTPENTPNTIIAPATVNIFAAMPYIQPSVLNSIAGEVTLFAKPVMGTIEPAPAYLPILS